MTFYSKLKNKLFHVIYKTGIFNKLDDEKYLKFVFRYRIGKKLNLDNPKTFNEKIQWLKINDRNPKYTNMVDKYEAKEYVKKIIGEKYIIKTLGIYDKFDDINFDILPEKFVIKCTHNSGGVIIVNSKKEFNKEEAKKMFEKRLKSNFYYRGREYPYKNIKPRIIIEESIQGDSKSNINDYKLMCFNGKVRCSFVCSNRNSKTGLCVNFYDEKWNPLPFERHYPKNKNEISKPECYDEMIKISEKLSKNIPFVRVDLYEVKNKVYFGELTFYPGSGIEEFRPEKWDEILGSWLKLPNQSSGSNNDFYNKKR